MHIRCSYPYSVFGLISHTLCWSLLHDNKKSLNEGRFF